MPSRVPNLQLRGGVYRLRVRVPDALRPIVGKMEITRSLGTGDHREASRLARLERVKLDAEWEVLKRQVRKEAPKPLSASEILHLVSKWFAAAQEGQQLAGGVEGEVALTYDGALRDLREVASWDLMAPAVFGEAKRLLSDNHLAAAETAPEFHKLQATLHSAMIELERRRVIHAFPDARVPLDPVFQAAEQREPVNPVVKTTLKTLIQDFQADPSRHALRGKTLVKRQAQWRLLESFFGSQTPVADIGRADVRRFMTFLETFPSNVSKHFPGIDPVVAAALPEARGLPVVSTDTANDYLRQLGALTRYALNEDIIKSDPAAGLLFARAKVAAKDKRHPFSAEDLKRIFGAPLYRGCIDDEAGYAKPGPNIVRRGRFWVPLIALFTGMRLNEICQLTLDDFVVEDGVDIILIRGTDDETKRVKTDAGQRFVPIHPELRAIGLLDHIVRLRRRHKLDAPVFADLPAGSTGYRSDPFSKFFARFLDHVGISHAKKVFHSFRHSYRDALREADISAERVRALGGWSSGRTEEHYGSGLKPSTLAREIERVRYPDLDLKALHVARS